MMSTGVRSHAVRQSPEIHAQPGVAPLLKYLTRCTGQTAVLVAGLPEILSSPQPSLRIAEWIDLRGRRDVSRRLRLSTQSSPPVLRM